jgi:purine-binding chemotaxis protein CheW
VGGVKDLAVFARIGNHHVAFDAKAVEAVIDLGDIVPVPLAPPHICGLAAVRSQVLTVVDVSAALSGEAGSGTSRRALVVARDKHRYALLVDAVEEVAAPQSVSTHIPPGLGASWARAARGTMQTGGTIALTLDIGAIITPND